MDIKLIKKRINEAKGKDTQAVIAQKLNMTQGNVSKLLSGDQLPQLDTIYKIAEIYDVSVDWILGLSEIKHVNKSKEDEVDYATAVDVLHDLLMKNSISKDAQHDNVYFFSDKILKYLVNKDMTLFRTDKDLHETWKNTKLSLFKGKNVLWPIAFHDIQFDYAMTEVKDDSDLAEVFKMAKKEQDEYEEAMKE